MPIEKLMYIPVKQNDQKFDKQIVEQDIPNDNEESSGNMMVIEK